MYALDLDKFIQWLLPVAIRKTKQVAWLNALLAPAKWLHSQFLIWTNGKRYEIAITGQVRVLEYHLNRLFDPVNQAIYIEDLDGGPPVYIFLESENTPVYLPLFLTGTTADFIVHCPILIKNQRIAIAAFLDKYKLPSKRYQLKFDL